MIQNDVACANFNCPINSICSLFNDIPNGELHKYAIYRPYFDDDGQVVCDHFTSINKEHESDRKVHNCTSN